MGWVRGVVSSVRCRANLHLSGMKDDFIWAGKCTPCGVFVYCGRVHDTPGFPHIVHQKWFLNPQQTCTVVCESAHGVHNRSGGKIRPSVIRALILSAAK